MIQNAAAFILMSILHPASQSTKPLTTPAQNDAPVILRGVVTAVTKQDAAGHSFDSFEVQVSASNLSAKSILLLISKVQTTGMVENKITHISIVDYFFDSEPFQPNTTKMFQETGPPYGLSLTGYRIARDKAQGRAELEFVQFTDGTTWGSSEQLTQALHEREYGWSKLKLLAKCYREIGENAFVTELLKLTEPESKGNSVIGKVRSEYSNNGVKGAVEAVDGMLHWAAEHQRALGGTRNSP